MTQAIPISTDFPVHWDDPADEQWCWQQDRLHYPEPLTPLDFSIAAGVMDVGLNQAIRAYEIPIAVHDRHINSYFYTAIVPQAAAPDAGRGSEDKLHEVMAHLSDLWEQEWLPEIQGHLAYWEGYDLARASLPALLDHLQETETRLQRVWEIHFVLFFPSMLAISQFADLYQDLFSEAGPLEAYELLAGFASKTLESGLLLWELSRRALASPTVRQVCTEHPVPEIMARLATSAEGRSFLSDLHGYLDVHGQRGDKLALNIPFWIEDPTPVIKSLQDYLTQPDRDLLAERATIAVRREQRAAQAREALEGYPRPVVEQFEFLLNAAQAGYTLKEEHGYWIDYKTSYQARQILLEIGRRLAEARVLETPDDIFYLYLDELRQTALRLPEFDRRTLITERQATEAQFAAHTPPRLLGTMPGESPPDDPITQLFYKIEGEPPLESQVPGELRGNAGSPGFVRGTAKVVRTLAEATKLEPGDILVAEATAPPWAPLFASVGAVVTDTGGILSHCAVIAREYGLPAVVGTVSATAMIQDGQTIEVDGNTGIVRIISS